MGTGWHFYIMILFSLVIFFGIIRLIMSKQEFSGNRNKIITLGLIVVVIGMLLGKYGAILQLPWWIYYPVPMLMTVLLPPYVLKLNSRKTIVYLLLSFLSAPFIHFTFSFFLGWKEYMPFWNIPSLSSFL